MDRLLRRLPLLVTVLAALLMLLHGPIPQWENYHAFADQRPLFGLPNAADVLSNIGFAVVGTWGLLRLWPERKHVAVAASWPAYRLFLFALILTALGSGFYHLAPDDMRLAWDRLPIALACAGLLGAVHADTHGGRGARYVTPLLVLAAILSIVWWYVTEMKGSGDLRPYVLLQALPLVLIPMWLQIHRAPRADKQAFGIAIALYIAAKFAELYDTEMWAVLGAISGHTIKHLLATAAAAVIALRLVQRTRSLQ